MTENDEPTSDTSDESSSKDHTGESGSTTETAPDTAGGAPTTSTPPAHRPKS